MIASGGLSGGISSSIAGGNFWSGVRQGLITSGLNHAAHETVNKISEYFEQTKTLDELAKELFGDDYKEKYGVKSFKLSSSIGKNGVKTSKGTHYSVSPPKEWTE